MADQNNRPMTDSDIIPPINDDLRAADPLKPAGNAGTPGSASGADFDSAIPMSDDTADLQEADLGGATIDSATIDNGPSQGKLADAKQAARDGAGKITQQATDKARYLAQDGKAKAGGALDQLSQMLTDAAGQVDDKLGAQYGQYARQAATTVQGFSDQVKNKEVDELLDDVRGFVRQSPAIAIGAAAAVGFVVARLLQAGLDDTKA